MEVQNYQILIKLLNGKHKTLNYPSPKLPLSTLKHQIHTLTSIPPPLQLLLHNSHILRDAVTLPPPSSFPLIVHLSLRLRGGKGGFGSLLRGAATKAGQKKTNNFDACRDMSGRRLRHVNAEKRLEEWKAEEGEREMEKVAEEWVRKKEKEEGRKRKVGKGEDAERYVAKYREQSEKCREDVERSVRESLKGVLVSKRKNRNVEEDNEAKRRKIRMGKRVADSDSDDMDNDSEDDDDDEENEKSAVIDNGSNSDSVKEANRSPDSITDAQLNSVSSEIVTSDSGTETEKLAGPEENPSPAQSTDDEDKTMPSLIVQSLDASVEPGSVSHTQENVIVDKLNNGQATVEKEFSPIDLGEDLVALSHPKSACTETEPVKPLNFNDYNSATEMEVLGMERLKLELQELGLKCGGTLQERAARLFLLKTTPLEKLPKKLFAKK